jgi:hypothetical protein
MARAKYVIVEARGLEQGIIFSELIDHCDVIPRGHRPVSAGRCEVVPILTPEDIDESTIKVSVWGGSVTLKRKPRPDIDPEILKKMIAFSIVRL